MLFTCEYHPFMLKLAMSHLHEYMWGDNGTNGTLTCGIIRASLLLLSDMQLPQSTSGYRSDPTFNPVSNNSWLRVS